MLALRKFCDEHLRKGPISKEINSLKVFEVRSGDVPVFIFRKI